MASTATTITFVTQALNGGAGTIAIELDEVKNNKKSQFSSGDTVFFKAFTSPLTMQLDSDSSAGTVTIGQSASGDITEILTFANAKEATVRFIGNSIKSFRWFGNNLGQPTLNGNQVTIAAAGIGALEIVYAATYREGNLSGVTIPAGVKEFPVVVVISEMAAT